MMLLNVMVGLSVLGAVMSATISSQEVGQKLAASHQNLQDYVSDALKSDRFVPVGSHANKALESTVYSLTGSIYQSLYYLQSGANDTTCSGLANVYGYPVNRCLLSAGYAFKLQLTQNACTGLVIQYYSDVFCQNYIGLSQGDDLDEGQCVRSEKNYNPPGSYLKAQCTTSATVPLIANGFNSEYFNTVDCTGSVMNYGSVSTGKCLAEYDGPTGTFTYNMFTCNGGTATFTEYTSSDCTTAVSGPDSIEYMCLATTDDNYDDDGTGDDRSFLNPPPSASTTAFPTVTQNGTSTNLFCPQDAPTLQPVFVPTTFPTSATAQQVTFDIKQQLNGITAATLLGSTTSLNVLKTTIANTMAGVTPADITNFEATDYSTGRRLGAALFTVGSTNIVRLTYTVSVMSIYSKTQLLDTLTYAVYSGAFTTDLNTNAQAATATDLYDCSSPNIIEPVDWDLSDDNLSGGAIAGIVIGCVVFVLLVGAIVYYCFCRRPSTPMSTHGTAAAKAKEAKGGVEM